MTGFILMLIGMVLGSFVAQMTLIIGQGKTKKAAFVILMIGTLFIILGLCHFIIYDYPTMAN